MTLSIIMCPIFLRHKSGKLIERFGFNLFYGNYLPDLGSIYVIRLFLKIQFLAFFVIWKLIVFHIIPHVVSFWVTLKHFGLKNLIAGFQQLHYLTLQMILILLLLNLSGHVIYSLGLCKLIIFPSTHWWTFLCRGLSH